MALLYPGSSWSHLSHRWPAFISPHIARWHSWPLGIHLICLWIFHISLLLSLHSFLYSTLSSCHFHSIPRAFFCCILYFCFFIPFLYLRVQVLIKTCITKDSVISHFSANVFQAFIGFICNDIYYTCLDEISSCWPFFDLCSPSIS